MPNMKTTMLVSAGGLDDHEVAIDVSYSVDVGYPATMFEPGADTTARIHHVEIIDTDGKRYPAPWLVGLFEDDEEMVGTCLLDWEEDQVAAEDAAADRAREERLLGDF